MYAVIRCGGKQYRVRKGDEIVVDRMPGDPGDKVELKDIVLVRGEKILFGPEAAKAKIKASIIEQFLGDKITVFKYKPKKNYRRKKGFRAHLTRLKIEEIKLPGVRKTVKKEEKPAKKETKGKAKVEAGAKVKAEGKVKTKVEEEVKAKTAKKTKSKGRSRAGKGEKETK
jgi:large subunit ribosomal protein L21